MKRFIVASFCVVALCLIAGLGVLAQDESDLATLIQSGNAKRALEQIQAGADVNKAQPDGTTPLIWAVDRQEYDVAEALLAKKADPNAANDFGVSPLTEAALQTDVRLVKMLLDAGARVDSANPDGETALMMAIKGGSLAIVQMLVDKGADVNNVEQFHQQTPLMYAASGNHAEIVKLLISKGAAVAPHAMFSDWPSQITSEPRWQFRPTGGLTALQYAARSGCYECAKALIEAKADVNDPTPEGVTPLMIALDNSHNEVAKLFMDNGAYLDVWDWWGRTPLWIAVDRKGGGGAAGGFGGGRGAGRGGLGGGPAGGARGGPGAGAGLAGDARRPLGPPPVSSMDIIKELLAAGVNPNPEMNFHRPNAPGRGRFADNQISTGTTPLFRAVQNNDMEVIQALLERGADPNINTMGYSAFLIAAGVGPGGRGGNGGGQANIELIKLMMAHFADPNAQVSGTQKYSYKVARMPPPNADGNSALHAAARRADAELVKYLLENGANPNLLDAEGHKPIDVVGLVPAGRGGGPGAAKGKGQPPAVGRGTAALGNPEEVRQLLEAAMAKK